MNLTAALRYLDSHVNLEATAGRVDGLSLDRMRRLCEVLGDPQDAFEVIHVTGTNGKGSVTRMTSSLLRASGLSVASYTSPHLEAVNERIAFDGEPIDDESLAATISAVADLEELAGVTPSYFEILTSAAFRWFADIGVDVAVVEVGLLGRYDATNVANGRVAVLTNVGRDHTDGTGAWRSAVASEKVGIVSEGATFVNGVVAPELDGIFAEVPAAETWTRGTEFACEANRVALGGRLIDVRTPAGALSEVFVPAHGAHQGDNATLAIAAFEALVGVTPDDDLVAEAFGDLQLPGRFEIASQDPLVILDGAHNPDGAATTAATLAEEFTLIGSVIIVVGMLGGRDPVAVLEALGTAEAGLVVACTPDSPRAIPAPEVAAAAEQLGAVAEAVGSVADAVARARAVAAPEDAVLVVGSLYVVGEARSLLVAESAGAAAGASETGLWAQGPGDET